MSIEQAASRQAREEWNVCGNAVCVLNNASRFAGKQDLRFCFWRSMALFRSSINTWAIPVTEIETPWAE